VIEATGRTPSRPVVVGVKATVVIHITQLIVPVGIATGPGLTSIIPFLFNFILYK